MLTSIENRLEELFELIETMPQDMVEAAEKVSNSDIFLPKIRICHRFNKWDTTS